MTQATFRIWRNNPGEAGGFEDFRTEVSEGMVVLDAVHKIQAEQAPDLACRWNCKAGKCGSCSAEINGRPRLMCMSRLNTLDLTEPVTVEPMRAFPLIKDLVTDVSWNFGVKKGVQRFRCVSCKRSFSRQTREGSWQSFTWRWACSTRPCCGATAAFFNRLCPAPQSICCRTRWCATSRRRST